MVLRGSNSKQPYMNHRQQYFAICNENSNFLPQFRFRFQNEVGNMLILCKGRHLYQQQTPIISIFKKKSNGNCRTSTICINILRFVLREMFSNPSSISVFKTRRITCWFGIMNLKCQQEWPRMDCLKRKLKETATQQLSATVLGDSYWDQFFSIAWFPFSKELGCYWLLFSNF